MPPRHKSIIAYLSANSFSTTASVLRDELGLGEDTFDTATTKKYETLLEKKWTSIVRLQKKIMDLESRNNSLQSDLDNATPSSLSRRNQDPISWLPVGRPRHSLESHREMVNCIAFHPTSASIASGSDDYTIKIWDWELGELERTIKGHTRAVLDVDFGGPKTGILLASCSSDLTIKLWDPANEYQNIRTLAGHDHIVSAVRFISSGAGDLLVSASGDKTIKLWNVTTGYCLMTLQGHAGWVRDVCSSMDGAFLLSASNDQTARLWDISGPTPDNKLVMIGHDNVVKCCAFAPPASYRHLASMAGLKKVPPATNKAEFMATGSRDKTIKLWDARGMCIKTLIGHDNWVSALVFHPGGKYLLSVADDKSLRCWDLSQEGRCVKTLDGIHDHFITSLRWAPPIIKEGSAGVANGEPPSTPKKGTKVVTPDETIRCVIATASVDMTLKIFAN
ncbi:nuclear distribution protein pac1-1 [Mariannaea sp. PMI_226]|nr:nuclear distribution protein pac1-1 [Mariannaea sp. PMI_226]